MADRLASRSVGFKGLQDWLCYIERVHPRDIDMGLDRVARVAARLDLLRPAPHSIIVAGTNGKGSTCVAAETTLGQLGLRVGTTLSPHLSRFNERVRIAGTPCSDEALCAGFAEIEQARGEVVLTYFEFSALVALWCFKQEAVDVAVLEVGLGGRLDAFNVVDADVAVITSIGLDHMDYLGNDEETIGMEKAGVMRFGRPAVLGPAVTHSVYQRARTLQCTVHALGSELMVTDNEGGSTWAYTSALGHLPLLPRTSLAPSNCALGIHAALLINELLDSPARLDAHAMAEALKQATLPGRMERIRIGQREFLLDVAHNPAAAHFLADQLARSNQPVPRTALLGGLRDKDSAGVIRALDGTVSQWIGVDVESPRGLTALALGERVPQGVDYKAAGGVAAALDLAHSLTQPGDVILVCGAFALVESIRTRLQQWTPS